MQKIGIKCTLESDLILTSTTATEGFFKSLDYIPGSKFMGLVASDLYDMSDQQQEQTLDIFHRGKVFFSDAHPLIHNIPTFRVPFDWYIEKDDHKLTSVYLRHLIEEDELESLKSDGIQIEQLRDYFFNTEYRFTKVDQNFSLKSAYNPRKSVAQALVGENFASKDQQLFGYYSLPAYSQWFFTIESINQNYLEMVKASLLDNGKVSYKRLGRSSSTEYGAIKLELVDDIDPIDLSRDAHAGEVSLYAFSNLCFYDKWGNPTTTPTAIQLGLDKADEVLWGKSQIRSRRYASYNKKRNTRNSDRWIIEKGSVFIVKLSKDIKKENFPSLVGAHASEGFGKLWLNPSDLFLPEDTYYLSPGLRPYGYDELDPYECYYDAGTDDQLEAYLNWRLEESSINSQVNKRVNFFINTHEEIFVGVDPSQWGQVRSISKNFGNTDDLYNMLFSESGFLKTGQSKEVWKKKERLGILKNEFNSFSPVKYRREFLIKLATEMAKNASNNA